MKTLILGLGGPSPARGSVGLEVARGLHAAVGDPDVHIVETEAGAVDLLELLAGYDKAVVVDCIRVDEGEIGELQKLGLSDLELVARTGSKGGAEYRATVDLARSGGIAMPREISIYAIEVGDGVDRSGTGLTEIMREAVPRLVAQIVQEEFGTEGGRRAADRLLGLAPEKRPTAIYVASRGMLDGVVAVPGVIFVPAVLFPALTVAVLIGVPAGIISGYKHNSAADVVTMVGANIGVSMPVFWLGVAPGEPMRKTEQAALHFQRLIAGAQQPDALVAAPVPLALRPTEAGR